MGLWVSEVIGDPVMVMKTVVTFNNNIKIMEDEKSREVKPGVPEWVGHPGIEIIVIPRRRIVSDYRRTFFIVVIIHYRRLDVFAACWRLILRVLVGSRNNS